MNKPGRRLEAPHRRTAATKSPRRVERFGERLVERVAVLAYRATSWLLRVVPARIARVVIGLGAQASYLAWPAKRRWSNANFGHVLGLPPDDRRVRSLALRAYREYGRYLVDLMRLPTLPPAAIGKLVANLDEKEAEIRRIWGDAPGGGLIMTVGHIGSNEAIAAGAARIGLPISVVADDTAFPELYEILRRQRAGWGFTLIPWRNLRGIFGVLRRREMLGLLIDWGYRSDGIPVRLFDAWTTLPAGPATLAAKTGSTILPISIHRQADGTYALSWEPPINVVSTDPAELQRASQAMADALAASIAVAPHQWYSFKPLWPEGESEAADLERRARLMQAGRPDPGPGRGLPRDEADQVAVEPAGAGPGGADAADVTA